MNTKKKTEPIFFDRNYFDKKFGSLNKKEAAYWEREGEKMALRLFKLASEKVPAYKTLLKNKGIKLKSIKTISDFKNLPIIDKASYLKANPYESLFPREDFLRVTTISATSGSTGEPFYFPRSEEQDWQYEYLADIYFRNQFRLDRKKTTLGLIGFGCGIWIGGIFTYKNFNQLAKEKYNLALAPVGPDINLYLKTVKNMGPFFDQIILMGYPPFVKDAIDRSQEFGIDWKKFKIKILTSAEGYSEEFRDYIAKKTGIKNILTDTINMYGSVELGTMAHETPLSIFIRRLVSKDKNIFGKIFPRTNRLPTLVQYYPFSIYFEEVNGEVIGTGMGSSIPLLRYRFPDAGGIIGFDEMVGKFRDLGIDLVKEMKKRNLENTVLPLPFVYVYERSDFAVKLHLRDIYPETIKLALIKKPFAEILTGKFTMSVLYNKKSDQYLELNLELRKDRKISAELKKKLYAEILSSFLAKTSGPGSAEAFVKRPNLVKIVFWPAEHPLYFKPGIKQRWAQKQP